MTELSYNFSIIKIRTWMLPPLLENEEFISDVYRL